MSRQAVAGVLVGLGSAHDGFARASDGALTLRAASGDLASGAESVAGGATAAALLHGLQATETTLPTNDEIAAMTDRLSALDTGAHAVADGRSALTTGLRFLADGTAKAAAGARSLADGTATLATGAHRLATGVGLHLASVTGTITVTLLVVASFLALQQALNAAFGPGAGKVVILALLMLQLAAPGGTYPVETTPELFRVVHPLLPMTYAVSGLREVITGGIDARLWTSVAYLGGLTVVSLAVTAWRAGRMRTWSLERLHPVLEI